MHTYDSVYAHVYVCIRMHSPLTLLLYSCPQELSLEQGHIPEESSSYYPLQRALLSHRLGLISPSSMYDSFLASLIFFQALCRQSYLLRVHKCKTLTVLETLVHSSLPQVLPLEILLLFGRCFLIPRRRGVIDK